MSTTGAAVIDVQSNERSDADHTILQFQDFGGSASSGSLSRSGTKEQIHNFTDFPDTPGSDDDDDSERTELRRDEEGGPPKQSPAANTFWSFAYYQSFFDVDTNQVLKRIIWSMIPNPKANYLTKHIRPNPDLYGPFWICATLVFSTAISGNLANYLYVANTGTYEWRYDFHKVSMAATTIYTYANMVPLALWLFLWYRKSESGYTLLEMMCVYGYSLAIYVPISVIWVIQVSWLQWFFVLVGTFLSGAVLLLATWPAFYDIQKNISVPVMAILLGLHFLLAIGFVMYFFNVPQPTAVIEPRSMPNLVTSELVSTLALNSTSS